MYLPTLDEPSGRYLAPRSVRTAARPRLIDVRPPELAFFCPECAEPEFDAE
jgi:hypothetical protein